MPKLYSFFSVLCFNVLISISLISCGGNNSPVLPGDNGSAGHNISGTGLPLSENNLAGSALPHENDMGYAPGEVLVTLRDGYISAGFEGSPTPGTNAKIIDLLAQNGLALIYIIPLDWGTVYQLQIMDGMSVTDKVAQLKTRPEIDIAEPNYRYDFCEVPYVPNDPFWENTSDSDSDPRGSVWEQFGPSKIGANVCWNENKGLSSVVVCVLDSGVQVWHEDLANNMWNNPDEIPNNGIDDDSNGYIDDRYGWDTAQHDKDITEYNANVSYHGTACSGVIAATQDNLKGCTGIAPGVRIMGVKCDLSGGGGYTSSVIEGVQYAADNGADIISMSFRSYSESITMRDTMQSAWDNGVILIGAAGNEDSTIPCWPQAWDCVMAVGATIPFYDQSSSYAPRDEVRISASTGYSWGSNYGSTLEVMGFGEYYITLYGSTASSYRDGVNNNFFNGTSNATPMVAGTMALLKSFFPTQDNAWLRARLRATADDLYQPGWDINSGDGRINALRACYGVDRFIDDEDANGFLDLGLYNNQVYDSIHDVQTVGYQDTVDLYKITAAETGFLLADLDIFSWGENLDLAIYSHPSMNPQYLLDENTGENHYNSSHEVGGISCVAGHTYYIKVFSHSPGDSSSYGLTVRNVTNNLMIDGFGTNDPGFIFNGKTNVYLGYIDFDVTYHATITSMNVYHQGTMPASYITGLHLYEDSDGDKVLDGSDQLVKHAALSNTNKFSFTNMSGDVDSGSSPKRFFITADIGSVSYDCSFELSIQSYKDITTQEGLEAPYDDLPIVFGPFSVGVDTTPPYWVSTTGIQSAVPGFESATLYWNTANDLLTPPVKYNVYRTQSLPFNFNTAVKSPNVPFVNGGSFNNSWILTNLNNNETYYVAVRAVDQAGNEEKNTVYLTVIPTLTADPAAPIVIGSVDTPGNAWEVLSDPPNERVFVADYNAGVQIIDVSSPSNPLIVDHVNGTAVAGLDYDGNYIYAAGASGLMIIDPDAPGGATLLATAPISNALDACVVGNWVYVTNFGTGLFSVNVTNPSSPTVSGPVASGNYGYGMDAQGNYLYISTNDKPRVYNISTPGSPSFIKSFGGNGSYECDAIGNRLYVTYWAGRRFSIYDLSNPADPQYMGLYQSNSGQGGSDIVLLHNYIYFGTNDHYIEVININNPASTYEIGQISTDGPDGLDTDGTFIFSAENEHGLKIIL